MAFRLPDLSFIPHPVRFYSLHSSIPSSPSRCTMPRCLFLSSNDPGTHLKVRVRDKAPAFFAQAAAMRHGGEPDVCAHLAGHTRTHLLTESPDGKLVEPSVSWHPRVDGSVISMPKWNRWSFLRFRSTVKDLHCHGSVFNLAKLFGKQTHSLWLYSILFCVRRFHTGPFVRSALRYLNENKCILCQYLTLPQCVASCWLIQKSATPR